MCLNQQNTPTESPEHQSHFLIFHSPVRVTIHRMQQQNASAFHMACMCQAGLSFSPQSEFTQKPPVHPCVHYDKVTDFKNVPDSEASTNMRLL